MDKVILNFGKNNVDYNINKVYENGVRVGNVPRHKVKAKRTGSNQSWFREAGQSLILQRQVLRLLNCPDCEYRKWCGYFWRV